MSRVNADVSERGCADFADRRRHTGLPACAHRFNRRTVIGQLLRYHAAGATDLVLNPFQTEPSALQLLSALVAEL